MSANTVKDPWYTDEVNFWSYRAIFNRDGLDYVPDRGGFKFEQKTPDRSKFLRSIITSGEFSDWVEEQDPDSDSVFKVDRGINHFRATNNRSYGYTYMWAWEDAGEREVEVYEFDLMLDGRRVDSVQLDENDPEHAMSTFLNEFCWEGKILEHQIAHVELVNKFKEIVDEDSYSPEIREEMEAV